MLLTRVLHECKLMVNFVSITYSKCVRCYRRLQNEPHL